MDAKMSRVVYPEIGPEAIVAGVELHSGIRSKTGQYVDSIVNIGDHGEIVRVVDSVVHILVDEEATLETCALPVNMFGGRLRHGVKVVEPDHLTGYLLAVGEPSP